MPEYLPINLRLDDRPVLVVGGGVIALQKVQVLVANGARVRVVGQALLPQIGRLPRVETFARGFEPADLAGCAFVIAATDDPALNHEVHRLAKERGLLVNVVDDPPFCDFIFPSILRRGQLAISVSTSGAGPALARMLREELEHEFDPQLGPALALLRALRAEARGRVDCPGARRALAEQQSFQVLAARRRVPADLEPRMRAPLEALAALVPAERAERERMLARRDGAAEVFPRLEARA